jgi:hypothetical protein
MNAPLSVASEEVFLLLDYLGEAAGIIESFARIAQENAALGSSCGLRHAYSQIYRVMRDAVDVVRKLEAAEATASKREVEAA